MVNEFSKFARMPSAKPVPGDLNALIKEVVELYAQAKYDLTFTFQPDTSIPIFEVDKEQMKRAVMNLLDNAVSAVGQHGIVTVSTRFDPDLSIASIDVADDGSGIRPEDRSKLFEPYYLSEAGRHRIGPHHC